MDIKVVAVDMDGTFLRSDHDYNREKFKKVFQFFEENGIKFVAISGNQYYQIRTFFEGYTDKIAIVGDNGAFFVDNNKELRVESIPNDVVEKILKYLIENNYHLELILDAEKSAYILKEVEEQKRKDFARYHTKVKEIDSYFPLPDDRFTKFSFDTPIDETYNIIDDLTSEFGDVVQSVTSGHGNIDIIRKGNNKGAAMKYLLDVWGVSPDNLMAFGDGGNDIEMLKLAKYSYAMENASPDAKEAAKYIAKSNNDDGVLDTIIERLNIEM